MAKVKWLIRMEIYMKVNDSTTWNMVKVKLFTQMEINKLEIDWMIFLKMANTQQNKEK